MNYILFNYGELPNYLNYCIKSIQISDKNSKIYICSDKKTNFPNTQFVDFNNFDELRDKELEIFNLFKGTLYEKNILWGSSILRVYALERVSKELNIKNFVHFDNDVVIYKSFNELNNLTLFNKTRINITQLNNDNLVFGYSYFPNYKLIKQLVDIFDEVFKNYEYFSNNFARGGSLNEMKILKIADLNFKNLFYVLDSLPYNNKKYLFDPASYGQYLGGTHQKPANLLFKNKYLSTSHIVGREIKSKRIKVNFKNKTPIVIFNDNEYQLANLHIHSKQLHKFLPN